MLKTTSKFNPSQKKLPADWRLYVVMEGVDTRLPGIYEWSIEKAGCYIGRYTQISRPTRAYDRHVESLLNGREAYRPEKPNAYRRIHRALIKAHLEGGTIALTILENVHKDRLNLRERELIIERGATLNG
jgi:hypothetical protein